MIGMLISSMSEKETGYICVRAKDMNPAPYDNFIGKVAYSIPKVGGIALVLTGVYGKILAGGAILGAVILHGIASVINLKREKDEDEAEHLSEKKE